MTVSGSSMRAARSGRVFFLVVFFLVVLGWAVAIGVMRSTAGRYEGTGQWPQVKGEVLASEVAKTAGRGGSGSSRRSKTRYTPVVTYSYEVNGVSYENDLVQFLASYDEESTAQEVVKNYPDGSEVMVYHAPDDPAEAVLIPGLPDETKMIQDIFLYAGIAVISVVLIVWRIRSRRAALGTLQELDD